MQKVLIDLKDKSYDIFIKSNFLQEIPNYIKRDFAHNKYLIVTDENVNRLYLEKLIYSFKENNIEVVTHIIPPGENSKSFVELEKIFDTLVENNFTRKDAIIGFGGGVVGDLTGFAAATYLRGVDFFQIPTTLLAQVDSSVGGKVAINLKHGKNLVGNFYQPKAVYIDSDVLDTLSEKEFKSGLAEVIKYACIYDENLFKTLMEYKNIISLKEDIISIIKICVEIKADFVRKDEKENHYRMHLNFGHTIGHGIEKYFNYTDYNHGEGVSMGINYILKGASKVNLIDESIYLEVLELLNKYDMPLECDIKDKDELLAYIKKDKKSMKDSINVILLSRIGESCIKKLSIEELDELLGEII